MLTLIRPETRLRRSYLQAHDEFGGAHRDGDGEWAEPPDDGGYAGVEFTREELETDAGFARFVRWKLDRTRDDSPRPTGHVPCTFFWVVDHAAPDTYLASVSVRHALTPTLVDHGGHIGYSVRPSARRRGVATEALRLALPEAAALGIDPALLTCHVSNAVSARVIETNGGVFEDVRGTQRRYWVPTTG